MLRVIILGFGLGSALMQERLIPIITSEEAYLGREGLGFKC